MTDLNSAPHPTTNTFLHITDDDFKTLSVCGICQEDFFFNVPDDDLERMQSCQQALKSEITAMSSHFHSHHCGSEHCINTRNKSNSSQELCPWKFAKCSETEPAIAKPRESDVDDSKDSAAADDTVTGSSTVVCFGSLSAESKTSQMSQIVLSMVDRSAAISMYRMYDEQTGLLEQCRRADRMLPSDVNMDEFSRTPVVLYCSHTICRGCAYKCVKPHTNAALDTLYAFVQCPMRCQRTTAFVADLGVEWLPIDASRIRLLKRHQMQQHMHFCFAHPERIAAVRCTHELCSEDPFMCRDCDLAEHSTRLGRSHSRVPTDEATLAIQSEPVQSDSDGKHVATGYCSQHNKLFIGVCTNDDAFLCPDCVFDHSGHNISRLDEMHQHQLDKLKKLRKSTVDSALVISKDLEMHQQQFETKAEQVMSTFRDIRRALDKKESEALFGLQRWRKMNAAPLKCLADELTQLAAHVACEIHQRNVSDPGR
jgi:B-box zinc finger